MKRAAITGAILEVYYNQIDFLTYPTQQYMTRVLTCWKKVEFLRSNAYSLPGISNIPQLSTSFSMITMYLPEYYSNIDQIKIFFYHQIFNAFNATVKFLALTCENMHMKLDKCSKSIRLKIPSQTRVKLHQDLKRGIKTSGNCA